MVSMPWPFLCICSQTSLGQAFSLKCLCKNVGSCLKPRVSLMEASGFGCSGSEPLLSFRGLGFELEYLVVSLRACPSRACLSEMAPNVFYLAYHFHSSFKNVSLLFCPKTYSFLNYIKNFKKFSFLGSCRYGNNNCSSSG